MIEEESRPDDIVTVYLMGAGHDRPELIAVFVEVYGEIEDGDGDVLYSAMVPYPIYVWDGYTSLLDMAADGRGQEEIQDEVWRQAVGPWLRSHGVKADENVGVDFAGRDWRRATP